MDDFSTKNRCTALTYEDLVARCAGEMLDVVGAFHPGDDEDLGKTLVLLGPKEPVFWPHFAASEEYRDAAPDPLDRWSCRVIGTLANELGAAPHFPFGGPPYKPFLRWAVQSGRAWSSPAGLLVHDTAGMMISFRGALALTVRLVLPDASAQPCLTCPDKPCLTACPVDALSETAGYDVPACKSWLKAGAACMTRGCAARRACPLSKRFPRLDAQSAFHMSAFLG